MTTKRLEPITDTSVAVRASRNDETMHFSIWRSRDGQYYWEAVGNNNKTMAVSETYTTKQSAQHAIDVVREQAASASVLDVTKNQYNRALP